MTYLLLTIPNVSVRRHFDTLNELKKVYIQISGSFENLSFSHEFIIVEHFKHERDNFAQSTVSQN